MFSNGLIDSTPSRGPIASMIQGKTRRANDPGLEAAALLLRVGMAILCLVVPLIIFFTRRSVVVLVPIGLTIIILASAIKAEDFSVLGRLKAVLFSPAGGAATMFCLWIVASFAWTPFPVDGIEKLFKALGTIVLVAAACLALPERMRAPNLNLITLGAFAAALLAIGIVAALIWKREMVTMEGVTLARASVTLSLLSFAAIAWLQTRAQTLLAASLGLAAGVGITLLGSKIALLMYVAGMAAFVLSTLNARATAWLVGLGASLALVTAPAIALAAHAGLSSIASGIDLLRQPAVALGQWGELIMSEPLRLLTGHGFDTATRARTIGFIAPDMPRGVVFEIWYELGLVGALTMAILVLSSFVGVTRLPRTMTAALTAAIVAIYVFSVVGDGIFQIWWLSSLGVIAVAFMSICNGQHRTVRPKARSQVFKPQREALS